MFGVGTCALAQSTDSNETAPAAKRVAHDSVEFWELATANADRDLDYDITCDVLYYNSAWNIMWVQTGSGGEYADPGKVPFAFKSGDRVRFRGTVKAPVRDMRFDGALTEVLGRSVLTPQILPLNHAELIDRRNSLVTFQAWVDKQDKIDDGVLRLSLSSEGRAIFAFVNHDASISSRALVDCRVQVTGVFAPNVDPAGNLTDLQIMVPDIDHVAILGSIFDDPRFDAPNRLIEEISSRPVGEVVRLTGEVISQDPGHSITIRDLSGQITLNTQQNRYAAPGENIEAAGVIAAGLERSELTRIHFRTTTPIQTPQNASTHTSRRLLNLAARIRELPENEAAAGHVANLRGVVTWSHPSSTRLFLADSSGGVEIQRSPDTPFYGPGAMLDVRGAVEAGEFAPIVRASQMFPIGTMAYPQPKIAALEHALSGTEDAQWISMQGFVFGTSFSDGIGTLEVSTIEGDFKIRVYSDEPLDHMRYQLVKAQGVCATRANLNHQLETIELWVPEPSQITTQEEAPQDPFSLPELSISRLGRFNPGREIKRFVKVGGTVLIHQSDNWLYLADEDQVLRVHTRESSRQPRGRRLEVVGRLGRDQGEIVLREAMLRTVGTGQLPTVKPVDVAADDLGTYEGNLISIRGTLINQLSTPGNLRLTVQNQGTVIDADLPVSTRRTMSLALPGIGAEIQLSGILVPTSGPAGAKSGAFSLHLSSIRDIKVLSPPPWWSTTRVTVVLVSLLLVTGMSFAWVRMLRKRVQQQTALITEQLARESRMAEQLQHATRLESLGLLAGGIAHDFNNLLTVVLGNLSLLRLDTPPGTQTDSSLSDAERAVGRAKQLTMQLLTFAKGGSPVRSTEDLSEIVRELTQFATRGSNVRCHLLLAKNAWPAHVDKGQIGQVVQNLVINALQAMPNGGELTLLLENEHLTSSSNAHLAPGRYLRLDITDTGCGIPAESLSRIFDPYFSTKQEGHGLGLATVYSIVHKHRGDIQVESVEGHGTTFHLWLPAAEDLCPKQSAAKSKPIPRGVGERILVMDDEDDIRALATTMLRQLGYEPVAVAHGAAALETFQQAKTEGNPFATVILDLTIRGGMGGIETLKKLRLLDPNVRAIVSSGYSSDQTIATHEEHGFDDLIPKPYEVDHFARVLHRTLHQTPEES